MGEERTTVELTFELCDEDCLFVAASDLLECTVTENDTIHRQDGRLLAYYTVEATAGESLAFARQFDDVYSARITGENDDSCLLEVVVDPEHSVAGTLATSHAIVKQASARNGAGMLVAEVPGHADPGTVVDAMIECHPGTTLLSKQHREDTDLVGVTGAVGAERYLSALTNKQRDAVRAAVQGGYLAWPRRSSATECAAVLGVSQPTFSQHLYRGLEVLLADLFDVTERELEESIA